MMAEASSRQGVQGRARGFLIAVASQLPAVTVGIVNELIDANECGVALEIMSEILIKSGAVISPHVLSDVSWLVEAMGLDRINIDRLRSEHDGL